jgi:MutS domain V
MKPRRPALSDALSWSMPSFEYAERLAARRAWAAREQRLHIQVGNARLVVFLAALWIGWAAFARSSISGYWLAAPAAVFIALLVFHDRVLRARQLAERAVRYYERGIARLEDRWAGTGDPGERYRDPAHPYAEDLDLFGKGGLFELLSTARTRGGEDTLARWLLSSAAPEVVLERQAAVTELRPKLDLREDLALLGEDVRASGDPNALIAWAEAPRVLQSGAARAAAAALSLVILGVGSYWASSPALASSPGSRAALIALLAINTAFGWRFRQPVLRVFGHAGEAARDLSLLAKVLARLEREPFASPLLARLRAALDSTPEASRRIARLNRLIELVDSRENWLMRIIGPPLLYGTQLAFAIEAWRADSGPHVRRWIEAAGEFEALSALAGYAYEHPTDPFPEVSGAGACFEAEGLGHPLLPDARCVRNDLKLGGDLRLLVVSGSNMSGKSTLLRSAGVSAVMAMAGAPVRARRLRISSLAVGASIRTNDSLQEGTSRFYAEITRLRKLVDLASGPRPLLFLIDELLHGTNSHDRQIGAEGVVRGLVTRGAIGLVTTHDLALTQIAVAMTPRGANVHFEDHLEEGRITFDYIMRPGVVKKNNALELMRSVGLDI